MLRPTGLAASEESDSFWKRCVHSSGPGQLPKECNVPVPPNSPLGHPKYHPIETIRPVIEVHWGV